MLTTLAQAPIGVPLRIASVPDPNFAARLARLGLYEGVTLMRLNESVAIGPAKVRGPKGEAVLSGWLAAQVVVHRDDNSRLPLLECVPGDSGHVEGLTGHDAVAESLEALGVVENDRITFLRRVPPMTYRVLVDDKHRAQINEGLASKLLGETPDGFRQFSFVGVGEPFSVKRILAGETASKTLASLHIRLGSLLVLTSVSVSHVLNMSHKNPIICVSREGFRVYFREQEAAGLVVSVEDADVE